jgi:hypothetical protein
MDYAMLAPMLDPSEDALRCGRGASNSFSNPKTATVEAGDNIGFALGGIKYPVDICLMEEEYDALTLNSTWTTSGYSIPDQRLHGSQSQQART